MRRSFPTVMGGGIKGGGGVGSGGMLRTIDRAVRAGVGGSQPEPISTNNETQRNIKQSRKKNESPVTISSGNNSNVSSSFSSLGNLPVSALGSCSGPNWNDESEWECLDSSEYEKGYVLDDDFVFGTVPSRDEAQHAVSALQQVFSPTSFSSLRKEKLGDDLGINEARSPVGHISSVESELDWVEPSLHLFNSRRLQPHGANRVYDAFHLLQTDPSVQKMVVSLSSDKAVWDAVLNNEVVQELRGSLNQGRDDNNQTLMSPESSHNSNNSNLAKDVLSWILKNTKAKIMELIEKITKLMNELFEPRDMEKSTDPWEETLKTSFFLSIMVLLVVVVGRARSA